MKMTKLATSLIAGSMFVVGGSAIAAGIADTKHNLSNSGTGAIKSTDQTEICVFCHTPHDAIKNNNIPLWNHTLSTVASYGVYQSPTMNATPTDVGTGGDLTKVAVSNLCLSCHDGTVAINSFNNPSNINPTTTMVGTSAGKLPVGNSNLGTDLTNDHPVNFTYDTALATADGTLKNPVDAAGSGLSNGVKLFNGKVQCASCHDPHSSQDPSGKAFLRASMSGSTMCLSCHVK